MMIRKRGDSWQAVIYLGTVDGKKVQKSITAPTRAEARRLGSALEFSKDSRVGSRMTLGVAFTEFLASRQGRVRGTTLKTYRFAFKRMAPLHHVLLTDLSPIILARFWAGLDLAPSSINRIRKILASVIYLAIENGHLTQSPLRRGDTPEGRPKVFAPTQGDVAKFMALADPLCAAMARLLVVSGARVGECCALLWSDIVETDTGAVITFARTITADDQGRPVMGTVTKTSRSRHVWIDAETLKILSNLERHAAQVAVFPPSAGYSFLNPKAVTRFFRLIWAQCSPARDWESCHGFRHYAASQLVNGGATDVAIKDRLGWASVRMLDRYAHSTTEADQQAGQIMAKLLG